MIDQTLGHFRITTKLGEGGMGEVYRAMDTRLGREVAIKVLPEAFVSNPERLGRFEREARVLASLNHPRIAGIHEVGEQDGIHFLVMELAVGETLAARIDRGSFSVTDAVSIALQIAQGLEVAHERGVVHRDLKPANVMVDERGEIKILDFGLAKAMEPEQGSTSDAELVHSPTLTFQATIAGTLLGTAAYMSPEQARGEEADRRADIWAFGVVLWEMLTGGQLFEGRTVSDTLAGILRDEIDVSILPAGCPAAIRRLLRQCLERDADRRLHDVADARIVLQDVVDGVDDVAAPETVVSGGGRRRPGEILAWPLAVLFLLAALGSGWLALHWQGEAASRGSVWSYLLPPEDTDFDFADKHVGSLALSPDGTRVAFTAVSREDRKRDLYVRPLDSKKATLLPGTEGATFPFWSPDGRFLAFFADGKLRKIETSGGPALTICDISDGRGGTWGRDGVIIFAPNAQGPLHRVSASGGPSTLLTELDVSIPETTHRHPFFLPDGRRFVYSGGGGSGGLGQGYAVWLASLDASGRKHLVDSPAKAVVSAGNLLYIRDAFLMAQPFDFDRAEPTGEPLPIADAVHHNLDNAGGTFSASEKDHLLFYRKDVSEFQLTLMDRDGRDLIPIGEPGSFRNIRLSPGGDRLVVTRSERPQDPSDLWVHQIESGTRTRLTFGPHASGNPVWSPDGKRIAYASVGETGTVDILVRDSAGGGESELLLGTAALEEPWDWSPDGRHLLFDRSLETGRDLWVLPLDGEEPFPLVNSEGMEGWAHFSPDGRWVAFLSNESGDWQLYATSFPDGGGKWQLTSDSQGAYWIVDWVEDGIHHITSDQMLAVLEVRRGEGSIEGGRRQRLMPIGAENTWASSRDGTRFVIGKTLGGEEKPPLTLVTNWTAGSR